MAYTISNTVIKNPSKACINRLRKMGEEKAKRLAKIQERWEKGEYENATVIHVSGTGTGYEPHSGACPND